MIKYVNPNKDDAMMMLGNGGMNNLCLSLG